MEKLEFTAYNHTSENHYRLVVKNILFDKWNPFIKLLTDTRDSISRVSRMTRAVEWSFGVGAVGVNMTVVCSRRAFVNVLRLKWKIG